MTPSGSPASFDSAAAYKALNGVNSAGFSTNVQPAANAGAHFHASYSKKKQFLSFGNKKNYYSIYHQKWVVPWNNLANNSDWLLVCHCKAAAISWDRVSMDFITPTGIITECINGTLDIEIGFGKRFAIVQHFDVGKGRFMLLNQIGQPIRMWRVNLTPLYLN